MASTSINVYYDFFFISIWVSISSNLLIMFDYSAFLSIALFGSGAKLFMAYCSNANSFDTIGVFPIQCLSHHYSILLCNPKQSSHLPFAFSLSFVVALSIPSNHHHGQPPMDSGREDKKHNIKP